MTGNQAPEGEPDLRAAAQAILDRWNSPKWEWTKQGPTADLMAELRIAMDTPAPQEGPVVMLNGLTEAETVESASVKGLTSAPAEAHSAPVAWSVTVNGVHCGNLFSDHLLAEAQKQRMDAAWPNDKRCIVPLSEAASNVQLKGPALCRCHPPVQGSQS